MILVTGGAGYIGSHTVRELRERGMDVVVYDNLSTGHIESIGDTPFVKGDLFDVELLRKTFREYGVDSVIHFAAYSLVGESMVNPAKYYHNNVAGTLALLDAMLAENVKYLVFSSSAATYGDCGDGLITENSPQNPTSVYGQTKLMMEQFMQDYDKAYGMKYVALRYFNAAGAHASGEIGEAHNPESHLIPLILQVSNGKREQINIFGDDYPTPDGTGVRDYIHVVDLAKGHVAAVKKLETKCGLFIVNLGTGKGYSVLDVLHAYEKACGKTLPYAVAPRREGDIAECYAEPKKALEEMGWEAKLGIEEMCASSWKWQSGNPNGYKN